MRRPDTRRAQDAAGFPGSLSKFPQRGRVGQSLMSVGTERVGLWSVALGPEMVFIVDALTKDAPSPKDRHAARNENFVPVVALGKSRMAVLDARSAPKQRASTSQGLLVIIGYQRHELLAGLNLNRPYRRGRQPHAGHCQLHPETHADPAEFEAAPTGRRTVHTCRRHAMKEIAALDEDITARAVQHD